MIRLRNLHKSYAIGSRTLPVLKGLDIDIEAGEFAAIMGSSGSGKSTLLNVLGILDDYDGGEYHLENVLMKGLSEAQAARYRNQYIGFVFQSFHLISFKNALENVAMPLYYRKISRKKRNVLAMKYLEMVGLHEWADHVPAELSGGQKQRVAIARALIAEPKVVLADEPTGALDSQTSLDIVKLFADINATGVTVIIVTHETEIAQKTSRIIRLRDGLIETTG